MNYKRLFPLLYLVTIFLLVSLLQSCSVFQSLDNLRQEADDLLVNYPKTSYKRAYIDVSHSRESNGSRYEILRNMLRTHDFEFITNPQTDPDIDGDTPLLAALRQDIGVLLLPEPGLLYSEKELRALELFVVFGGRIITTTPPAGNISQTFLSLLSKFGMGVSNEPIQVSAPMYFPETEVVGQAEPSPERGHIMNVDESLQAGFHYFDQVLMLFPRELTFEEDHGVFTHAVVASKTDGRIKSTALKATSKLNPQLEKGFIIVLGDSFMAQAPIDGGTRLPDRSGYQGGMITSGNYKFIVNAMTLPGDTLLIDGDGPAMNTQMPQLIIPGSGFLSPTGGFTDLGGIAKISYRINGSFENVVLDAFVNRGQRRNVQRSVPASRFIRIPETVLNPGRNTIQITVTDQFLNVSTQSLQFDFALSSSDKHLVIASTFPNSDTINPEMGVDATGPGRQYPNRATFGGPLSESIWDGQRDPFCQDLRGGALNAFTLIRSAPQGAGRVVSMLMPATQGTINRYNTFSSLISFHFEDLSLDNSGIQIVNHGEVRVYENFDSNENDDIPGSSEFMIAFEGTPIIVGPMNDINMVLVHNAPGNCNDDVINFTSNLLPLDSLSVLPDLPSRENDIANAFLADLANTRGIRYRGTIFNRILHGANSEFRTPEEALRFPVGVPHPDPAALGLNGFARIEIIR